MIIAGRDRHGVGAGGVGPVVRQGDLRAGDRVEGVDVGVDDRVALRGGVEDRAGDQQAALERDGRERGVSRNGNRRAREGSESGPERRAIVEVVGAGSDHHAVVAQRIGLVANGEDPLGAARREEVKIDARDRGPCAVGDLPRDGDPEREGDRREGLAGAEVEALDPVGREQRPRRGEEFQVVGAGVDHRGEGPRHGGDVAARARGHAGAGVHEVDLDAGDAGAADVGDPSGEGHQSGRRVGGSEERHERRDRDQPDQP